MYLLLVCRTRYCKVLFIRTDLTFAKTLAIYRSKTIVTQQVLEIQQPADKKIMIKQEPSVDFIYRRNAHAKDKSNSSSEINRLNFSKSDC